MISLHKRRPYRLGSLRGAVFASVSECRIGVGRSWLARAARHVVVLAAMITPMAHAGIVQQFQGGSLAAESKLGGGFTPPDMGGAVGNGFVMQMLNGYVGYWTTSGSSVGSVTSLNKFWDNAGLSTAVGGTNVSDPRVIYDPASGHWFASAISTQNTSNNVLVAVSKTNDPTKGFTGFSLTSSGNFADYPTLGVNSAAVTIGVNNFSSSSGSSSGVSLYSIPKASLTASTPSISGNGSFLNSTQIGFTPQAVTNFSGSGASTTVLSNTLGGSNLYLSTVSGANASGATVSLSHTLSLPVGSNPFNPLQLGGTSYSANDNRLAASFQVGNLIYFANNVSASVAGQTRDVIQWGILNSLNGTIVHTGLITSSSGLDFTFPSISANSSGTFVIGFNGSGPSTNISGYYVICSAATGTCSSPSLAINGAASNYSLTYGGSRNRWGDYSWTTVDPSNPSNFWLFQETPATNSSWATTITALSTASAASVPAPGTIPLMLVGTLVIMGLSLQGRRRARLS